MYSTASWGACSKGTVSAIVHDDALGSLGRVWLAAAVRSNVLPRYARIGDGSEAGATAFGTRGRPDRGKSSRLFSRSARLLPGPPERARIRWYSVLTEASLMPVLSPISAYGNFITCLNVTMAPRIGTGISWPFAIT
jgi:hypothetical protein